MPQKIGNLGTHYQRANVQERMYKEAVVKNLMVKKIKAFTLLWQNIRHSLLRKMAKMLFLCIR